MYAEFTSKSNTQVIDCSWDQKIPNEGIADRNWFVEQIYAGKRITPQPSFKNCFKKLVRRSYVTSEGEQSEHKQFDANTESELLRLSYYNPKDAVCYKAKHKLDKKNKKSINKVVSSVMIQSAYPCQTKNWFNNQTRMKTLSDDFKCGRPERHCSTMGI